jgi:nucleotide-binding universal stress UspA family protein
MERSVLLDRAVLTRSVLCPVDFSEGSRTALVAAAGFVRQCGGVLHVLFVEHPLLAAAERDAAFESELRGELGRFVAETPGPDLQQPVLHVLTGDPADAIVALADRERVDAVVMGTHGLTGVRKAFLGSTTARVLRRTRRPVVVVPASGWHREARDLSGLGSILVLTDFGPAATGASMAAARLAQAVGARLVLAHVLPSLPAPASWGSRAAAVVDRCTADANRLMSDAITPLKQYGPVESVIVQGNIAERAAELAHSCQAGLVAVGLDSDARGSHPGSTAYAVICRAPVAVLAVAAPAEDGA